jgi:hypothetical protein
LAACTEEALVPNIKDKIVRERAQRTADARGAIYLSDVAQYAGLEPSTNEGKTAMGIAWAESRLDAKVESKNPDGGTNIGLMQIDDKAHPDADPSLLHDPYYNMKEAARISGGGKDWSQWATYSSGAYKKYYGKDGKIRNASPQDRLGNAVGVFPNDGIGGIKVPDPAQAIAQVAGAIGAFTKVVAEVFKTLFSSDFWTGIGKVLLGLILLYMGLKRIISVS